MPKEQTPIDVVIADLKAERDQLNSMISALERRKAGASLNKSAAVPADRLIISEDAIPSDAFFGMTLPDAAHKYLSLVKNPKPHPELCDALLEGGFKTGATNFREVVRSTLSRHPDFVRVRRGEWGLKEWYNRGPRRAKRVSQEEPPKPDSAEGTEAKG